MKVAIISDIHGNLAALETVLRDIQEECCARTYCLGDVVGYGPAPNEVCARVREAGIPTIQGNHDEAAALDIPLEEALLSPLAYKSLEWTRRTLSSDHRRWLRELPKCIRLHDLSVGLYHANPLNLEAWDYITSRYQAWEVLERQAETLSFIGHTHQPFVWEMQKGLVTERRPEEIEIQPRNRYLINVGSVGQPRNRDPRSTYAILDTEARWVRFRMVEYPVAVTQRGIKEQNLPDRLAERLARGV